MGKDKICINLDVTKKMKLKIDKKGLILYANNYFSIVTKYQIHEIILKDMENILHDEMPDIAKQILLDYGKIEPINYFIIKGKTKDNDCYWGFVKMNQDLDEYNEVKSYSLEIKLLPNPAISKIEKLFEILREIEKNAGKKTAQKYLEGYLEEKNLSFKDYIFDVTEINEKKAEKYFEIDEDSLIKKKKAWF